MGRIQIIDQLSVVAILNQYKVNRSLTKTCRKIWYKNLNLFCVFPVVPGFRNTFLPGDYQPYSHLKKPS